MRRAHTFTIPIERPASVVYDYLANPKNHPSWSAMSPDGYHRLENGDWAGQTSFGLRHVRFTPPNPFGVLDHAVFEPGGEILFSPMRVIANEESSLLLLTFFQRAGMSEELFASTLEWIEVDLLTLKTVVEALR